MRSKHLPTIPNLQMALTWFKRVCCSLSSYIREDKKKRKNFFKQPPSAATAFDRLYTTNDDVKSSFSPQLSLLSPSTSCDPENSFPTLYIQSFSISSEAHEPVCVCCSTVSILVRSTLLLLDVPLNKSVYSLESITSRAISSTRKNIKR
jgi:hypothetical protein